MITRVLNARGEVTHDCAESGCEVSWDGYALRDGLQVEQPASTPGGAPSTLTLNTGDPLPGRTDPGAEWVAVDARTVRRAPLDAA